MSEIVIQNVKLVYTPEYISQETGTPIEKEIMGNDSLDFKNVLDKNDLGFTLTCGTLLGAIREHNFINHDYDIDVIVKDESTLLRTIPELQKCDFRFIRYQDDPKHTLYTFRCFGVWIDVYIANKCGKYYYLWKGKVSKKYVDKTIPYPFLGEIFSIPRFIKNFWLNFMVITI